MKFLSRWIFSPKNQLLKLETFLIFIEHSNILSIPLQTDYFGDFGPRQYWFKANTTQNQWRMILTAPNLSHELESKVFIHFRSLIHNIQPSMDKFMTKISQQQKSSINFNFKHHHKHEGGEGRVAWGGNFLMFRWYFCDILLPFFEVKWKEGEKSHLMLKQMFIISTSFCFGKFFFIYSSLSPTIHFSLDTEKTFSSKMLIEEWTKKEAALGERC